MADAMEVARSVRDRVTHDVTTDELRVLIESVVQEKLGPEVAATVRLAGKDHTPMVRTTHGVFPFSKGTILKDLNTAGVALEEAVELVRQLEERVRSSDASAVSEQFLHEVTAKLLVERQTADVVRRYRLTNWVSSSSVPVIILIGGATGTGKSTLAMELAYRLGVVWVTSTDMVRETMRAVLSPSLVPGLHDHSFRGMVVGGQVLSDPRERVLVGFRQQMAQVAVGIRAVIQRAIYENAHIIIEGTHIVPPFDQYLPPGANAHVAGFTLAVPDEEQHRRRFPERSHRQPARSPGIYLDAFQSVRWIHEDMLRMAEEAETVVLSNADLDKTLRSAVDILSRGLPLDDGGTGTTPPSAPKKPPMPTLFLIMDGLGDEPNAALAGKTPLEAADAPHLRRLARSGGQGQIQTARNAGDVPSTDEGTLALLCADPQVRLGRGLLEALGEGVPLPQEAVVFRGNLASVDNDGGIVDRRAGRIKDGVVDLLAPLSRVPLSGGLVARVYPGHEHRVVVTLLGTGLSASVTDTDPGGRYGVHRINFPVPTDSSPEAARTAEALSEFLTMARESLPRHPLNATRVSLGLLPANALLTRGASVVPQRRMFARLDGMFVGRCSTARGIARYLGLKTATSATMTGNLDTDLDAKFVAAGRALGDGQFVVVHVKGTDIAAHDRRPMEKSKFISAVDAALGRFLAQHPELSGKLRIVVSADHGTSSVTGQHMADPVPLLLATWQAESSEEAEFSERSSAQGALGLLGPGELPALLGIAGDGESSAVNVEQRYLAV